MAYVEVRFVNTRSVSKATLGRLPDYLRYLKSLDSGAGDNISAAAIARALRFGDVQVRKDLGAVSGAGKPRVGYNTRELIANLEDALGLNNRRSAVLVGAGRLGRALMDFEGFSEYGVEVAAAFDIADMSAATESGKPILPMTHFEAFLSQRHVDIGIITVPQEAAQQVCDRMLACGILAIWSFAPGKLKVPEGVIIQQEDLALSLANLNRRMAREE